MWKPLEFQHELDSDIILPFIELVSYGTFTHRDYYLKSGFI